METIDDLYMRYMNMSKQLIQYLGGAEKVLAKKWIIFAANLPRDSGSAPGETRCKFIKHLFEVIKDEVYLTATESEKGQHLSDNDKSNLYDELQVLGSTNDFDLKFLNKIRISPKDDKKCMSMWTPDKRTYIAAKPLPGEGALIYLAVAERPDLGWDLPDTSLN